MQQQDYIQRMINQATEALAKLLAAKKNRKPQEAVQVFSSFWLSTFDHTFGAQDLDAALNGVLDWSEGNLECLQEMFAIVYEASSVMQDSKDKRYGLQVAKNLLKYITEHSDTYDFQQQMLLQQISAEIDRIDIDIL